MWVILVFIWDMHVMNATTNIGYELAIEGGFHYVLWITSFHLVPNPWVYCTLHPIPTKPYVVFNVDYIDYISIWHINQESLNWLGLGGLTMSTVKPRGMKLKNQELMNLIRCFLCAFFSMCKPTTLWIFQWQVISWSMFSKF